MKQTVTIPSSHLQHHLLPSIRLLIWLACASLAQPFAALAQTNAPAPLPPAAQEAVNKGIIAAKVPDYLLAIRYFEEARKIAPDAPVIYLNLGLAESKIPGRELRAIAWFGAYLAAYPDATNTAAVKEQIAVLDVRNQSNLARLLKTVQEAAMQLPIEFIPTDESGRMTMELVELAKNTRDYGLKEVSELWARVGDIPLALKAAESVQDASERSSAQASIAAEQARAGDIVGAQRTSDSIQSSHYKGFAQSSIANAQAEAGDIAGAQKTADSITVKNLSFLVNSLRLTIARAQAKVGDIKGARKTADSLEDGGSQAWAYAAIAEAQAKAGDIAGAQKTAESIREAPAKGQAQSDIAKIQAEAGDIACAQKTADGILDPAKKASASIWIARAQARAGDIVGARNTAGRIQNLDSTGWAEYYIAMAQAEAGDIAGAQKTADGIKSTDRKSAARSGIAEVQGVSPVWAVTRWIRNNDDSLSEPIFLSLGDHLRTLPSGDARKTFVPLLDAAKTMVRASTDIAAMLKQQTKR